MKKIVESNGRRQLVLAKETLRNLQSGVRAGAAPPLIVSSYSTLR